MGLHPSTSRVCVPRGCKISPLSSSSICGFTASTEGSGHDQRFGETDPHAQSGGIAVEKTDGTAVPKNHRSGNGESEPHSVGMVQGGSCAIKRFEHLFLLRVGHARSFVIHV